MKLTEAERVILHRLHEVLAALHPDERKEHEAKMTVLRDGYHEEHYRFDLGKPVSKADQAFVKDVLDLYRGLNASYAALPSKDKASVDKKKLVFPGFDGNNETDLMAFAMLLVRDLGLWAELKSRDLNSHMPMRETYARMLAAAKKPQNATRGAAELKAILDAK